MTKSLGKVAADGADAAARARRPNRPPKLRVLLQKSATAEVSPAKVNGDTAAPPEEEEPGGPKSRRRRRRRGKGDRAEAPEGVNDAGEERDDDIAPTADSTEDNEPQERSGEEVDDLSNWNIPSWQDLIAGLYRPPDR